MLQFNGDEGLILDQDAEGVNKDDMLPRLSESDTMVTEEDDVTVLEENAVLSPTADLSAAAPESGSESFPSAKTCMRCIAACVACALQTAEAHICLLLVFSGFVEEDLLLEDVVQTPAAEKPPPEEIPVEIPSPELPDIITLPEPPVEVEASGSGDLEEPLKPAAPTEADVSFEHIEPYDGLVTGDDAFKAEAVLEADKAEVEMVEEAAIQTVDEEQMNGKEVLEELEITTTASKITYEEGLPAVVLPAEAVDLTKEARESTSETSSAPADESSEEDSNFSAVAPTDKVDNAEQPGEDPGEEANVVVVLTNPAVPVLEEDGMEAAAESEGQEVMEETLPEAPAVETEGSESPQILMEDLTEDEILLVNRDETGPPIIDVSRAHPTVLSPERESPFTLVSDINPVTQEHPHVNIPSLLEVTLFRPGEGNGK